jgi:phospholipid/cholesterol/gamma-HCH transport system substrate-binding protein
MAKRVSSTAIGAFVLSSLALIVLAIVILGSGRLFRKPHYFICFFTGNLNGLNIGAPVKVRGVQIGTVSKISLRLPASDGQEKPHLAREIPVYIEIDETQLKGAGGTGEALKPGELSNLIQLGLRAQLNTESLLTGLLYIDLDFHPDAPANFVLVPGTGRYPEVPTIPTTLQQVQQGALKAIAKLDEVDFVALTKSITDAANSTKQLLGDPALKAAIASLKDTSASLKQAVVTLRATLQNANEEIDPLAHSLMTTSSSAQHTLDQATVTLAQIQGALAPGSPLSYQLSSTLENMSDASRKIGDLADFLQRNPSSLVRGKYVNQP